MEKNSHYFLVGIFVTISLIAVTFFVIWLAGTHDSRNYNAYTVYFTDPVSGLKDSAAVQYRGVAVGRVRDIRLVEGETELIKVDIEVSEDTPIYQKTQASLATQGITGLAYIELTSDAAAEKTPPSTPPGERYPVIQGQGTQLSKLFQDVPAISKQVLELSEKLNRAFDDESVQSLGQTVRNVEEITADMNRFLSDENIENTTVTLRNIAQTSERLDQLVARFDHTADQIDKAADTLNSVLTDNKQDINKFAGSGLNQITEMSRETREMARSIRRLADRLEQDPSRLIYKPNYRGVEIER